jgi:hypothetical protein
MTRFVMLLLLGSSAAAQDSTRLPIGSLSELRTRGLIQTTLRGRAMALDTSGIRLSITPAGSSIFLPWGKVTSLRWATEKSRARGTVEGAIAGLAIGAGLYINGYPWDPMDIWTRGEEAVIRRRLAIFAGSVAIGATTLGLALGSRKWSQVPLSRSGDAPVSLSFHPEDEVRVESTLGRFEGFQASATDSLRIVSDQGPVTFPWRHVGDLQVRGGHRRARGILYGAAITFAASSVAESFTNLSTAGWISNVVIGGALGWKYLSPEGWTSLPQPTR